jgi:hypothetical protein
MASGTKKLKTTAVTTATKTTSLAPGVVKYLDALGKRVLITITSIGDTAALQLGSAKMKTTQSVQGIISAEYSFSVKNQFESLLSANQTISGFSKGINAINQLALNTNLSVVPYSPQIWMGAEPLRVSELLLHFVCYNSAKEDVHDPLMKILGMSLPTGKGAGVLGTEFGMLNAPPAVEIQIGNVIRWSPCFIESAVATEKAPYDSNGYGMIGEAKITIIRRDFIFADDFISNQSNPTNVTTSPSQKK